MSSTAIRILFVDDDAAVLRALIDICGKDGGFSCSVSHDGAEARARIMAGDAPDVVVSDQRMPAMSGVELFRHLRISHPSIVRVLMTAEPSAEVSVRALDDGGVHAMIEKPWRLRALLATLRSASALARAQRVAAFAHAR